MFKRAQKQTGFTIVELLIVVVVIAILAAITIVAYNGIQNRAYDSSVQSDMENFSKIVEMNNGEFSVYPQPITKSLGIKASKNAYKVRNNLYYCVNTTTNQYALAAISKSGKGYAYSSVSGKQEYTNGDTSVSGANTCGLVGLTWSTAYAQYGLDGTTGNWDSTWLN